MLRAIALVLILIACLASAGCGSGIFERLGDIPDHCTVTPADGGWISLDLTCTGPQNGPQP